MLGDVLVQCMEIEVMEMVMVMVEEEVFVRPGTAGLLTGIECSRVRDSSWMYLTSFVTTRIGVVLAAVQGNYPIML